MRLTWVQPQDLVARALRQAVLDEVEVADVQTRWSAAEGDSRGLAEEILDELDRSTSPYDEREPTDWAPIAKLATDPGRFAPPEDLPDRVHGGWLGRAAGCLLGKPVEKISRRGIREILEATGRWPLRDWFTAAGLPAEVAARWPWNRRSAATSLAENIVGMPEDDDLNFALVALALLEQHGAAFGSDDVAQFWLDELPAGRVFTAERIAYRNLLLGYAPPYTARVRNPFRDWIGAQIRGDVFGWACPGHPARAAELAWRDAVVSHTRNGVYGELFVAAACARAVTATTVDEVLDAALAVVPPGSRYAEAVRFARSLPATHGDFEAAVDAIDERYGDLHWVHVLNNAALVVAALVYSRGDFEAAVTAVVSGGWDTDSNGATVGSIMGALTGAEALPQRWVAPLRNRLASSVRGFDGIGFDDLARRTVAVAARLDEQEA